MVGFILVTIFVAFSQYAVLEGRIERMSSFKATITMVVIFIVGLLIGYYYHVNYSFEMAEWFLSFSPYYNK